jgi:hypothetical protein
MLEYTEEFGSVTRPREAFLLFSLLGTTHISLHFLVQIRQYNMSTLVAPKRYKRFTYDTSSGLFAH